MADHDIILLDQDSFTVFFDSLVELPLVPEGEAQAMVGLGIILLESDGIAVCGDSLIQPAVVIQCVAEAIVGLGVILLEPDSFAVLGYCLGQPTVVREEEAEVIMGTRAPRAKGHRHRGEANGFLHLRRLLAQHGTKSSSLDRSPPES